jgi:hypothetical protein
MGTTTSRRRQEVLVDPSRPTDPPPGPVRDAPVQPPKILIKAARRRQRRRWAVTLLVIAAIAGLVAGLLASVPPSGPTRPASHAGEGPSTSPPSNLERLAASAPPPSRCPTGATTTSSTTQVTQSIGGAFSACLRVGNVASGQYHVVVNAAITHTRPRLAPYEPRIHLSISPRSGRPGTRVTVTGVATSPHRLTTAPVPNNTSSASLCWGTCPGGLTDDVDTVHWSSPTTFHVSFKVPAAPWIEVAPSGKARVVPLVSGTYRIGVRCVGPFSYKGCGLGAAEASVTFRIVVPEHAEVARCPTPTSCAFVGLGRRTARPAQAVEVRGVAPLISMIGTRPVGASLEVLPGPASGPQIVFGRGPEPRFSLHYHWVHMGDAPLDVKPPPSFASLGHFSVLSETDAGLDPVSGNPGTPDRVAHCAPGAVLITSVGPEASTPTSIPTATATSTLVSDGYLLTVNGTPTHVPPSCAAVALPRDGPAVFVAFGVAITRTRTVQRDVALETFDGGASWSILPAPAGATDTGFGGFRYQGLLVEALYWPTARTSTGLPPLVEQFDPASGTWHAASLGCPSSGPCVTLGAYAWSNCAGGLHASQGVLRSANGGASWSAPVWPSRVDPCADGELAAISASSELLVHGSMSDTYTILRSTNGGATWIDVGLPRAPFTAPTGVVVDQLALLSNGALLALETNPRPTWWLLVSGSQRWCKVQSVPTPVRSSARSAGVSVFHGQLWWISVGRGASSSLGHVGVTGIKC